MSDATRRGPPSSSPRKRPYDHHDGADERPMRLRSNDLDDDQRRYKRRSHSPSRAEHAGHRDHERHHHHRRRPDERRSRHDEGGRPRSPARHRHRHRHREPPAPELPCQARPLSRSADFDAFRPLFARYLDVQKQIDMATLDDREIRGRWKSFVSKWNNSELAEGWYRPETFEDAQFDSQEADTGPRDERRQEPINRRSTSYERRRDSSPEPMQTTHTSRDEAQHGLRHRTENAELQLRTTGEDDEDEDDYGPTLPGNDPANVTSSSQAPLSQTKHGPGIPTLSDITLRRELETADRDEEHALLRRERKADRTLQKEREAELAPRADPGSQARRLEKRREVREANASFATAKSSNDLTEMPDAELMGGDSGGGGIEEYKRHKQEAERKRSEREIRREEVLRAKREEREERIREYREREAHTVDMLREIAKARFG
ncbi:hypothetical protein F4808DRAFT_144816 [Astrocystis sublimbata]|nr:hypothetical protein F4808DRAFT_144816 [Astrocystis sublimbata]